MNYVIELLSNDKDNFEKLVEVSRLLSLNEVELRQLNNLKQLVVNETPNAKEVSYSKLTAELSTILKGYNDATEI